MKHSLFENSPQPIFETVENEDYENIGQSFAVATASWSNVRAVSAHGRQIQGTLTFYNAAIRNFNPNVDIRVQSTADFSEVTGWTATSTATSASNGGSITVTITFPYNTVGIFRIGLRARSVWSGGSPSNNAPAADIWYPHSRRARGTSINNRSYFTNVSSSNNRLTARFYMPYGRVIPSVISSYFQVTGTGRVVQSGWSINISRTRNIPANGYITVTATPPRDTNGSFAFRLIPNRIAIERLGYPPYAVEFQSSGYASINNAPYFSNVTGGTSITARLNFRYGSSISGISGSDFTVSYRDSNRRSLSTSGSSISVSSSTASGTGYVTITVRLRDDVAGEGRISLNASSLRVGSGNSPKTQVHSSWVAINNQPYWSSITGGATLVGILQFRYSGTVTDISASDFNIRTAGSVGSAPDPAGWTIAVSSASSSGSGSIRVTATPPLGASGSFFLRLRDRVFNLSTVTGKIPYPHGPAGVASYISSGTATINNRIRWTRIQGGTGLHGSVYFPYAVTGISSSDFRVVDSFGQELSWSISIVGGITSVSSGGTIHLSAYAPLDTNDSFRFRLKSGSLRAGSLNAPPGDITSGAATVVWTAPVPTVATAAWSNMVGGRTITGRLTFTGARVSGIEAADIQVLNASNQVQSGWNINVSRSSVTNGGYADIRAVAPANLKRSYKLRITASSTRSGDSTRNDTPRSSTDSALVAVNTEPIPARVDWTNETGGPIFTARLYFSDNRITDINTSDIEVLNASDQVQSNWQIAIDSSTVSTYYISISATPPSNTNARFSLRIKALSMASGGSTKNNFPTASLTSDERTINNVVTTIARAEWSDLSGGTRITGTVTFRGDNVRGVFPGDFEVLNSGNIIQQKRTITEPNGWVIEVSTTTGVLNDGGSTIVTARPPRNVRGIFKLRLKALSVRSGTTSTDNAPALNTDSTIVSIDNTGTVANIAWTSIIGGRTLTGVLSFSNADVTGIFPYSFYVLNSSNQIQSDWLFDISSETASSGDSVTITVTPPDNTNDEFRLQLRARNLNSGGGRRNAPVSALNSNLVLVDNVSAGRTRMTWVGTAGGTTLIGILRFSEARVSGIAPGDFRVLSRNNIRQENWTITVSHTSRNIGEQAIITATAPADTNGWFRLQVRAFSMISGGRSTLSTPNRNITSIARQVDNRASIVATAEWTSISGNGTIVGNITFSGAAVTGITGQDFDVLDNNNNPQSGWIIGVSSTSAADGGSVTVTGAPPSRVDDLFKLRLKANRVNSDRTQNNAPSADVISNAVTVDNIITIARATWTNILGGNNLIGFLQFTDAGVEGVESSDFQVLQASSLTPIDEVQSGWDIHISKENVIAGDTTIITATPPSNTFGRFYLKMLKETVMSDGDNEDNSPLNDVSSLTRAVDTRPIIIAEARWTSIEGGRENLTGKLIFTNTFASSITSNAFQVQNSGGVEQTDWNIVITGLTAGIAPPNVEITITATPTTPNKRGAFRLQLTASSVKSGGSRTFNAPGMPVTSNYASVDTIPARIATATWKAITGGTALKATIAFHNAIVTGIESSDFEILNDSDTVQQDAQGNSTWEISVSSSIAIPEIVSSGDPDTIVRPILPITVDANPPDNTNGSFKIRLKALSVMSDGVDEDNAPRNVTTSTTVPINNANFAIANVSWSGETALTGPVRLQAVATFTGATVAGINSSDFAVVDINNSEQNWNFSPLSIISNTNGATVTINSGSTNKSKS